MDVTIKRKKRKKKFTRVLMMGIAVILFVRYFQYRGRRDVR